MRRYAVVLILAGLIRPPGLAAQADSVAGDVARADSALARRTSMGTRISLPGSLFRTFPNDSPDQLLGLVPGVVLRGAETGLASAVTLAIRGGQPGAVSVYVDGAPVRFNTLGRAGIGLGAASLAEASVTTGPPDVALSDLRDGVIAYETRSGGARVSGFLQAATDEAFAGVGYNRFEGGIGGPLAGARATWFVGGTVTGQGSHYVGAGSAAVPSYVPGGTDTIVSRTVSGQTETVALPRFVDRRAYDWGTELRGHAKVDVSLGAGSRLAVTGVANETQERFFPGMFALAPSLYTGTRSTARLLVVNWRQELGALRGRPLALRINASLGSNREVAGLLEAQSERATVDPALGITLETLRFTGADVIPFPLTDQIIRNVRTNSGLRVPYLNRDELRNVQQSRANPYGMDASWVEQGLDGPLTMSWEQRAQVGWALDWAAGAAHALSVGGNLARADMSHYTANLLRQSFMDVYRATPSQAGFYIRDRLVRGSLRAEFGLRFDHVGGAGVFPRVPGRIYSNPAFNRPGALVDDTAYENSMARVAERGRSHKGVSGRVALQHALSARTAVHAAAGRWLAPPGWDLVLTNTNSDLDFTSTLTPFGRDIAFGHGGRVEVGATHQVREGVAADVALYWTTRPRYVFQRQPFADPANPADVVNVSVLTHDDEIMDIGADLAIDWTMGRGLWSRAVLAIRTTDYGVRAGPLGPVEAPLVATQAFTGAVRWRPPGGLLAGFEGSALVRLTSGTWYTTAFFGPGSGSGAVTPPFDDVWVSSNERLPWTKRLDVRVRRSVLVGPSEWSFFAEARNLFGWENILALFAATGSVDNALFKQLRLDAEFQNLEREAADNGRLLANGDIDLAPNCASWTVTSGVNGAVVNCVALRRAEARFGNGDQLYSLAERTTALSAFYNAFYGPQTFYGQGRSVRLGVEIRW